MKFSRGLIRIVAVLFAAALFTGWFCSLSGAEEKTYEIRPEIEISAYQSDAVRILNAYERLMDRYMGLVEGNIKNMSLSSQDASKKLDAIDKKLDALSWRIGRIEKALGIEPPKTTPVRPTTSRTPRK